MSSYTFWTLKRRFESFLLFPFILLGRIIARVWPLDREYRIFYFFPFYHTGGAEKVHLQIVQATGGPDCIIFFTRRSQANTFRDAFQATGCHIRDISRFTDNKWIYFVNLTFRGILSGYINRQKKPPLVFQGHSNIAYKTAPWIRGDVRQVDLVHSLNSFSSIRIPFIRYYQQTVLISQVRLDDHRHFYQRTGVPERYIARLCYIGNAVDVPIPPPRPPGKAPLSVLFSGRNSPEKRLALFLRVAEACLLEGLDLKFEVLGDDGSNITARAPVRFLGNQSDPQVIWSAYQRNDVLLLTSATEGMPLAVIEALGSGCTVLATPVGDLPLHIEDGRNGYVFSTVSDETQIVHESVQHLRTLAGNRSLLAQISNESRRYYDVHFSMPAFVTAYRSLLRTERNFD